MFLNDNNKYLLDIIEKYSIYNQKLYPINLSNQKNIIDKFTAFINSNSNCFLRQNTAGHITGSAFVVNESFTKVLFTYHAKLKKWLQLGGHADGEFIIQNVAMKEAQEESGINHFNFIDILNYPSVYNKKNNIYELIPFDLDIHLIPKIRQEPAHFHYDVRFILVAQNENYTISSESLDLKWIHLDEVIQYTSEESTLRQVSKIQYLNNDKNIFN